MKPLSLLAVLGLCACHSSGSVDEADFAGFTGLDLSAVAHDGGDTLLDGGVVDTGTAGDSGGTCAPSGTLDGGDPTGTWAYASGCATADAFYQLASSCVGFAIDSLDVTGPSGGNPSGTLSLHANHDYTRTLTARMSGKATVPASCVTAVGDCNAFQQSAANQFPWLQISCAAAGTCRCTFSTQVALDETGSWQVDPDGFTLTAQSGGPQHFTASVETSPRTLAHRGDDATTRGNRGVTLTLH